jgi:hypothetical protein
MEEFDYLKNRLEDQIKWYDKKSIFNQSLFKILKIVEIVISASIPLIIIFKDLCPFIINSVIALIGVSIVIIASISSLYKFQENWVEYRTTCEILKHHKYLFLTKTEPYNNDDSLNLLVNNVETLVSKENSIWAQYMKKTKEDKKNG